MTIEEHSLASKGIMEAINNEELDTVLRIKLPCNELVKARDLFRSIIVHDTEVIESIDYDEMYIHFVGMCMSDLCNNDRMLHEFVEIMSDKLLEKYSIHYTPTDRFMLNLKYIAMQSMDIIFVQYEGDVNNELIPYLTLEMEFVTPTHMFSMFNNLIITGKGDSTSFEVEMYVFKKR